MKPAFFVRADAAEVVGVGDELDAAEAQVLEGVAEERADGVGAVAAAPGALVADDDCELGAAVQVVDVDEASDADEATVLSLDGEDEAGVVPGGRDEDFAGVVFGGVFAVGVVEPVADVRVVEGGGEPWDIWFANGAEADAFAGKSKVANGHRAAFHSCARMDIWMVLA